MSLSSASSIVGEKKTKDDVGKRFRIVDADAHIDPPYEMWRDYLPAHLRELAPYIEEGEEHDWIVFEGSRRPVRMISNLAGAGVLKCLSL